MSDLFKDAPEHLRKRRQQLNCDRRNAGRDDCTGVEARFRLAHGFISEFVITEMAKGTDASCLAHGLVTNLAALIANFAMNTANPTLSGIHFLQELAYEVMPRLMLPADHPENDNITIVNVDPKTGRVSDFDVLDELGRKR